MQVQKQAKKFKIIKSSDSLLWYTRHVGEIFDVEIEYSATYWTREKDEWQCLNFVNKEDTELV